MMPVVVPASPPQPLPSQPQQQAGVKLLSSQQSESEDGSVRPAVCLRHDTFVDTPSGARTPTGIRTAQRPGGKSSGGNVRSAMGLKPRRNIVAQRVVALEMSGMPSQDASSDDESDKSPSF